MLAYSLRRILMMIPTLWGIVTIVFLLMYVFVPGDPARIMLGQHADAQAAQNIRVKLGLDKPLYVQYGKFLLNFPTL